MSLHPTASTLKEKCPNRQATLKKLSKVFNDKQVTWRQYVELAYNNPKLAKQSPKDTIAHLKLWKAVCDSNIFVCDRFIYTLSDFLRDLPTNPARTTMRNDEILLRAAYAYIYDKKPKGALTLPKTKIVEALLRDQAPLFGEVLDAPAIGPKRPLAVILGDPCHIDDLIEPMDKKKSARAPWMKGPGPFYCNTLSQILAVYHEVQEMESREKVGRLSLSH